jgi:hypothetical protein
MAKGIKTGGRQSGTPNKITSELREKLKSIIDMELDKLPDYINGLDNIQKLDLLVKLIPYVLPKVTPIESTANEPMRWDF